MISLSEKWYLENRRILHACAPGVRVRWTGGDACECGVLAPRRVRRFYEWMRAEAPIRERRSPPVAGLTVVVFDTPVDLKSIGEDLHRPKS